MIDIENLHKSFGDAHILKLQAGRILRLPLNYSVDIRVFYKAAV